MHLLCIDEAGRDACIGVVRFEASTLMELGFEQTPTAAGMHYVKQVPTLTLVVGSGTVQLQRTDNGFAYGECDFDNPEPRWERPVIARQMTIVLVAPSDVFVSDVPPTLEEFKNQLASTYRAQVPTVRDN